MTSKKEQEDLDAKTAARETAAKKRLEVKDERTEDDPIRLEEERQQREQAEKDTAAARDAAERQFHRNAHSEELGTGIDGLLQVLYRRGLVSIPEIEAITGKDIPPAEEVEMEADRDKAA